MNKTIFALALCLPALALAQALPTKEPAKGASKGGKPAAAAPSGDGPVATVNGTAIPRTRMDAVIRQQTARGAPDSEQMRAQVREALINNELLNQEANRSGAARRAEVTQQIDLMRQEVIANSVIGDYVKAHPVTDAEIQKEYDTARSRTGDKEYKARHILVATEDEAKAVLADLKKGTKFEEIASKRSMDEGTRPRGGDLDWNVPSTFDKIFADAMIKLEKGRITDVPVRTRFGFHIIQLEDVRAVNFPPLQQVRGQIQQRIVQQRVETLVKELRAKAKIE